MTSMIVWLMNTWNKNWQVNRRVQKKHAQCQLVRHKSHMTWPWKWTRVAAVGSRRQPCELWNGRSSGGGDEGRSSNVIVVVVLVETVAPSYRSLSDPCLLSIREDIVQPHCFKIRHKSENSFILRFSTLMRTLPRSARCSKWEYKSK
jgi:hypothetical protein